MTKLLEWDKNWLLSWNRLAEASCFSQALVKYLAQYLIYSVPFIFILLWFWSAKSKKIALRALFSAGLGLALAMIIGKSLNRSRPFEGGGVQEILFHRPDYSFPSDHATLLFAIAMSFYLGGYKKLSYLIFLLAVIIGAARVAAGVHYPSDIIAGAVVGIIAAYLIKLLDPFMNHVYIFLIGLAKKVRLA